MWNIPGSWRWGNATRCIILISMPWKSSRPLKKIIYPGIIDEINPYYENGLSQPPHPKKKWTNHASTNPLQFEQKYVPKTKPQSPSAPKKPWATQTVRHGDRCHRSACAGYPWPQLLLGEHVDSNKLIQVIVLFRPEWPCNQSQHHSLEALGWQRWVVQSCHCDGAIPLALFAAPCPQLHSWRSLKS